MNEYLLHYAWQYKMFDELQPKTVDGEVVEVINVGQPNKDAGPDFFNAKIKINGTLWAGNVEIHSLASDWFRHQHDKDERYDSIILHVVGKSDTRVFRNNGSAIPQIEVKPDSRLVDNYERLLRETADIRCGKFWGNIDPTLLKFHLSRMAYERLARKADEIQEILAQNKNDWSGTFYLLLMRGFGMHTNSLPFELLAKSLPLKVLAKHKNSTTDLEALLLGQAALLPDSATDNYSQQLIQTYHHLRNKFSLTPIDPSLWKFARMRPSNFPYIKIAQVATLIHHSEHLFSKTLECRDVKALTEMLRCEASGYWLTHYRLGKETKSQGKQLDLSSVQRLLINVVIPMKFTYARVMQNEALQEECMTMLEQIPPEKNRITAEWGVNAAFITSAYTTQALIELKTQYCDTHKCLRCHIGHHLLQIKPERPIER